MIGDPALDGDELLGLLLAQAVVLPPHRELLRLALLALDLALGERDGDVDVDPAVALAAVGRAAGVGVLDADLRPPDIALDLAAAAAQAAPSPTSTLKSPVIFQFPTWAISASAKGRIEAFSSVCLTWSRLAPRLIWPSAVFTTSRIAPRGLAPTSIVPCVPSHHAIRSQTRSSSWQKPACCARPGLVTCWARTRRRTWKRVPSARVMISCFLAPPG